MKRVDFLFIACHHHITSWMISKERSKKKNEIEQDVYNKVMAVFTLTLEKNM